MRDVLSIGGSPAAAGNALSIGMPKNQWVYVASPGANSTSGSLGVGTFRCVPVLITEACTLTGLAADVATAGDAGSHVRLGVFADGGASFPTDLVVDAGTIAGDSATVQSITGLTTDLAPGLYWFGAAVQDVTTTQPVLRTTTVWTPPCLIGTTSTLPGASGTSQGYAMSGLTGALPSSWQSYATVAGAAPRLLAMFSAAA